MKPAIAGLLIIAAMIAVSWAMLPKQESSSSEKILFIRQAMLSDRGWTETSREESQTPDTVVIAKQIQEKKEESVLYEEWSSQEERRRFIKVAIAFSGTPYKLGGITAQGMDCSGFTYMVYRLFGVSLPRTVVKQCHVGRLIERCELEEGDLVFFDGTGKPLHVGIYLGDGKFIHASSAAKQIRTDFIDTPWQFKRFIAAVRVRELRNPRETR